MSMLPMAGPRKTTQEDDLDNLGQPDNVMDRYVARRRALGLDGPRYAEPKPGISSYAWVIVCGLVLFGLGVGTGFFLLGGLR